MHRFIRHRLFPALRSPRSLALMVAVLIIVLLVPHGAQAAGNIVVDTVVKKVLEVVANIILWMIQTVGSLAALAMHLLIAVAQFNQFTTFPPVVVGYNVIRDIANMFFIVGLLIIAGATVLNLKEYGWTKWLSKLIIMAFLVNQAKFITGFLIQSSQVVMLTFVNAFKDAMFGNFTNMLGLTKILQFNDTAATASGDTQIVISLIAGLVFVVIAFIVIAAITWTLTVRVVYLWILTIMSPMAYALRVTHWTQSYASKWWSTFGKFLVSGPIIAFFLWLAMWMSNSIGTPGNSTIGDQVSAYATGTIAKVGTGFSTEFFNFQDLAQFVIAITFLFLALQQANELGGMASAGAKRISDSGFKFARGAAMGLTGMNFLRDRTIAPYQKYRELRKQRISRDIADRGASMMNSSDRLKTISPLPGMRRQALQNVSRFEEEQIIKTGSKRANKYRENHEVEGDLRSRNMRVVAAAVAELQKRKVFDPKNDPNHWDAVRRIKNSDLPRTTKSEAMSDFIGGGRKKANDKDHQEFVRNYKKESNSQKDRDQIINKAMADGVLDQVEDEQIISKYRESLKDDADALRNFNTRLDNYSPYSSGNVDPNAVDIGLGPIQAAPIILTAQMREQIRATVRDAVNSAMKGNTRALAGLSDRDLAHLQPGDIPARVPPQLLTTIANKGRLDLALGAAERDNTRQAFIDQYAQRNGAQLSAMMQGGVIDARLAGQPDLVAAMVRNAQTGAAGMGRMAEGPALTAMANTLQKIHEDLKANRPVPGVDTRNASQLSTFTQQVRDALAVATRGGSVVTSSGAVVQPIMNFEGDDVHLTQFLSEHGGSMTNMDYGALSDKMQEAVARAIPIEALKTLLMYAPDQRAKVQSIVKNLEKMGKNDASLATKIEHITNDDQLSSVRSPVDTGGSGTSDADRH